MKTKAILLFFLTFILVSSCRKSSKKNLAEIEKQELAKGMRNDSLFRGLYFGMPKQAFFDHCWEMNKLGVFTEGAGMTVEYDLNQKETTFPLRTNFYPRFGNDKIAEMPVLFTYRQAEYRDPIGQTEALVQEVKRLMQLWYGGEFFITTLPTGQKVYAQVSGNRRILILTEKEFEVMVIFTDLTQQVQ